MKVINQTLGSPFLSKRADNSCWQQKGLLDIKLKKLLHHIL
jgi:hypothetical protein